MASEKATNISEHANSNCKELRKKCAKLHESGNATLLEQGPNNTEAQNANLNKAISGVSSDVNVNAESTKIQPLDMETSFEFEKLRAEHARLNFIFEKTRRRQRDLDRLSHLRKMMDLSFAPVTATESPAVSSITASFSDGQSMGSQETGALQVNASTDLVEDNSSVRPSMPKLSIRSFIEQDMKRRRILDAVEFAKKLFSEDKKANMQVDEELSDLRDNSMDKSIEQGRQKAKSDRAHKKRRKTNTSESEVIPISPIHPEIEPFDMHNLMPFPEEEIQEELLSQRDLFPSYRGDVIDVMEVQSCGDKL